MRALYIDDNEINLKVVEAMLQSRDVHMTGVQNGPDGLAALDAQQFDWLFVDLRMPGMDGFEVIRRVRGRGDEKSRIPIFVITADMGPSVEERSSAAGADRVLRKPVMLHDLFALLQEFPVRSPCVPKR